MLIRFKFCITNNSISSIFLLGGHKLGDKIEKQRIKGLRIVVSF
jgi:hypothetical protein